MACLFLYSTWTAAKLGFVHHFVECNVSTLQQFLFRARGVHYNFLSFLAVLETLTVSLKQQSDLYNTPEIQLYSAYLGSTLSVQFFLPGKPQCLREIFMEYDKYPKQKIHLSTERIPPTFLCLANSNTWLQVNICDGL